MGSENRSSPSCRWGTPPSDDRCRFRTWSARTFALRDAGGEGGVVEGEAGEHLRETIGALWGHEFTEGMRRGAGAQYQGWFFASPTRPLDVLKVGSRGPRVHGVLRIDKERSPNLS